MKGKTIFLCAGGTGGHVFPAIAVYHQLKKKNFNPLLITDARSLNFLANQNIEYFVLPVIAPKGGRFNKLKYLLSLSYSTFIAFKKIISKKPFILIGFGGYPSFPTLAAAALLKKRIIIHEQNSILGHANQVLAKYTEKIATSFFEMQGIADAFKHKVVLTGNPVRNDIINIGKLPFQEITENSKLNVLVTGGSQGSKIFSTVVPQAIKILPEKYKAKIHIEQQCRVAEIEEVKKIYDENNIDAETKTFFIDMPERIARAHICICRSGASTLAELASAGRAAIFIPLPTSKLNHQEINARYFEKNNAAEVILEKDFTPAILAGRLIFYLENSEALKLRSQGAKRLSIYNSAQKIVDLI
ncbi:MAG TPA: undecaprenyldiphospho-muramoylpentapeptide beta-N-acetylglucosaminyltransferase [Alphaproteobacteria bacterium]|nr:undecaprenyldiphospho-muramoylpentapeptide beta-N-acetylglucosaminyltransferase [Alphaproteobacteria bacterium]